MNFNFTMFVAANFPKSIREIQAWLDEKENGATRVPKLVNTSVCNMLQDAVLGLQTAVAQQVVVITIFYELEWPKDHSDT